MLIVDANVILRYLLDDHPKFSAKATEIIANNDIFMPYEVLCEVVYVLQKVYQVKKEEIQFTICDLIQNDIVFTDHDDTLVHAMELYFEKNIDIVDAILCAYSKINSFEIKTFDKKLQKCLNQK